MDVSCLTPILNVSDMAASFAWFEKLGWRKLWDWGTPIRDILVHLMENEAGWVGHVIRGEQRRRIDPAAFGSLDVVMAEWQPLRAATAATILGLTAAERESRRPLPWDTSKTVSVEEVVWHVVAHDQYHQGQVFTRLALLGRRGLPDHDLVRAT